MIDAILDASESAYNMFFNNGPIQANGLLFVLCLLILLYLLFKVKINGGFFRGKMHPVVPKESRDQPRLFTEKQKREIHYRARKHKGSKFGTCEWIVFGFISCPDKSTEADHWYPHANGGKTTMKNAVALCKKHNGRKSNHIPSNWTTMRIAQRRKSYYHFKGDYRPGEWMTAKEIKTNKRNNLTSDDTRRRRR